VSLFSGRCEGGPINGKMLHHGEPTYIAAVVANKIVTRSQDAKRASQEKDVQWSTYEHKNGRWICKS
jgi:hypothetical protein